MSNAIFLLCPRRTICPYYAVGTEKTTVRTGACHGSSYCLVDVEAGGDGRSAEENAELMKKAARGLMGRIPGLLSLDISSAPLQSSTVPLHLVLCSTHTDEEALKGYAVHPLHLECINIMKNVAESRQALDYEIQE